MIFTLRACLTDCGVGHESYMIYLLVVAAVLAMTCKVIIYSAFAIGFSVGYDLHNNV